jgi:hypothetical protein
MKIKELTQKQLFSVRCSTCGASAGQPCRLHAGEQRREAHPARRFAAADTVENNRIHMD